MDFRSFPNFRDWYWTVAGDASRFYSSARNIYVDIGDADFIAWGAGVRAPTPIANEIELWDVLTSNAPGLVADWLFDGTKFAQPAVGQYSKTQLASYAASRRYEAEVGGIKVSAMPIATDRESQAMISGAFNFVSAVPSATVQFKTDSGFVALNAAQIQSVAIAVATHVQACFSAEATVGAGIASGTIATLAAIDAAFVGI